MKREIHGDVFKICFVSKLDLDFVEVVVFRNTEGEMR